MQNLAVFLKVVGTYEATLDVQYKDHRYIIITNDGFLRILSNMAILGTPLKFNIALKMDGWKTNYFPFWKVAFQGRTVKLRVCI